jgi:ElaB/YqjD/DUF883 family membrane-anchored ribosome-binding protein
MSTTETGIGNRDTDARRYAELRETADRDASNNEPQAIERDIDATRADMRATLEALERRFSFDRLVDLTVGRIRERGGEFAGNLTDAATRNPMPLVLTSIGLAWMMLASRGGNQSRDGYRSRYSDTDSAERASGLRDRVGDIRDRAARAADQVHGAVDSTRDTLKQAAESSREAFEQTAESLKSGYGRAIGATREQAEHALARMDRLLHDQPLMLGALGLAAGAIIGALLPTTEHEDRLLGDMRRKAVKDVAQKSRALYETARNASATDSARDGGQAGDGSAAAQPARPH